MEWELVDLAECDPAVRSETTAIYRPVKFPDSCRVGVMRKSLFSPPTLWFTLGQPSKAALRESADLLEQLLLHLGDSEAYAETNTEVSEKFARFVGFQYTQTVADRKQFVRRL